jgi:hypothetical protein
MGNMQQISSAASQVIISIIPIVGIVIGGVVVFFYLLRDHRRKTLLIKSGQYNKPHFDLMSFSLLTGLLLGLVGLVLTVFLAMLRGKDYAVLGGLIPLSLGLGLLTYYVIQRFARG